MWSKSTCLALGHLRYFTRRLSPNAVMFVGYVTYKFSVQSPQDMHKEISMGVVNRRRMVDCHRASPTHSEEKPIAL